MSRLPKSTFYRHREKFFINGKWKEDSENFRSTTSDDEAQDVSDHNPQEEHSSCIYIIFNTMHIMLLSNDDSSVLK